MSRDLKYSLITILCIVVISLIPGSIYQLATVEDGINITVINKESVKDGDSNMYLIFTDQETFRCSDSLFHGKFNSSDMYGRIFIGETYKIKVYGKRIGFFSMYRNIIELEHIPKLE